MIVAITGGTGFIGRKLVIRHLELGDEVRVLSRRMPSELGLPNSIKWWTGDLANPLNLMAFVDGADVLYHCAGEIRDPARMKAVHVDGTRKLIGEATGRIGRWVQLSSVGAYGGHLEGVVTEKTVLNPRGTYEVTKVGSDALVAVAASNGAFDYAVLRPSNVYGAEMTNRSLFSLIEIIRRGLFCFIGKPGASANYIHVDNVVEALMLCGTIPPAVGQIYNLSDNRPLEDFVANIAEALGMASPTKRLPKAPVRLLAKWIGCFPGSPLTVSRIDALTSRAIYPNTKIEQKLGYQHTVSMEQGIWELVDYWKRSR